MIIKHEGTALISGKTIVGYAVNMNERYYIFCENGSRTQVRPASVMPLRADLINGQVKMDVADSEKVHSIYLLKLSECILEKLRSNGVHCLEDLQKWTDAEYKRINGLGLKKQRIIQETLEHYHLMYQGTDQKNNK